MIKWLKQLFCKIKPELKCPFYDVIFGECGAKRQGLPTNIKTNYLHCIDNPKCHYRQWKCGKVKITMTTNTYTIQQIEKFLKDNFDDILECKDSLCFETETDCRNCVLKKLQEKYKNDN